MRYNKGPSCNCSGYLRQLSQRNADFSGMGSHKWNVWAHRSETYPDGETAGARLEQIYNLQDALAFGGLICSLFNHADRITMACLAQLVHAIAPIYTRRSGH